MSFFEFFIKNFSEVLSQTFEHIELTLISLFFASLVGISTGILLTRSQKLSRPVIGFVNIIQTIPSIALLGFLIPLFGIGVVPAIIALFLYALLPIVRNTFTGISEIDGAIIEAAKGMGMTNSQILSRVEIPLALPMIFAGLRTASVINVGVATLSAFIAAGGLGEFIFRGIQLNNTYMIFAGAIPASLLAVFFDSVLGIIQRNSKRAVKPFLVFIGIILLFYAGRDFQIADEERSFRGGFPIEFIEREDGLKGLLKEYNMEMDYVELEIGLMYKSLQNGDVDVVGGFSTDGRIQAYNLAVLEDNRNFFPPYFAAPMVRQQALEEYPGLRSALDKIAGQISDSAMIKMNYEVDELKKQPEEVAKSFLRAQGFKVDRINEGSVDVVIGSKAFTENYILAHIFSIIIENYSGINTELKLGFGGTKLIMDAMKIGEVDLYPEYTGTALLVLLKPDEDKLEDIIKDRAKVFNYVKESSLKEFGFEWLDELGFNNTHVLMMRKKDTQSLSLKTIGDLREYLEENSNNSNP
ncbi:MAG: ABC transporter permease/substrate-binding protein [Bacteroidota bacterium]